MHAATLDALLEKAIGAQRGGRLGEAAQLYRSVLERQPRHPVASHNLGILTALGGDAAGSVPLFETAWQADPGEGLYWVSYARALLLAGRIADAGGVLREAQAHGFAGSAFEELAAHALRLGAGAGSAPPSGEETPAQIEARATALVEQGAVEEAVALYRRAIELDPDFADAHFHLGSVLSENDRVAEGFAHYMRRARLVHGGASGAPRGPVAPEPRHKLKHDREQREYLAAQGATDGGERFHLANGERVSGPAVNPVHATAALLQAWSAGPARLAVIDEFLTPPALERLRAYCAGSTVWRRVYAAGYIGATPEDGFACPLLAQIVEETRTVYRSLLGAHGFRYLGAFKYDSELSTGTNTHADFSAVNVNLYITPDDANLDAASGGMRIWGRRATSEAEMRRYNGDEQALREMLERTNAPVTVVPHRANRAVIFDSALYHRTDQCRFREGYLNKRINVSLLFGAFAGSGIMPRD